jgi:acyl transferase domain-containing protein/acyl carrier protein
MSGGARSSGDPSAKQRFLTELKRLRERCADLERKQDEPIAIVGVACRFPAAVDLDAYWRLLHRGKDAISEVPPERWDVDALFDSDPDAPGKTYARWGGFLEGVDRFDPLFFGISPHEAAGMDPQQRLLLEVSWEAIENAGVPATGLMNSATGVFIGISTNDYQQLQARGGLSQINAYMGTGINSSVASGRIAYLWGLQGPTVSLDTACSSSLVALHLACQSLRGGECDQALAGGVNLILSPEYTIAFSKARMLSPDGRCKTFDAAANGYVRGEGCGVVMLKRLSDALEHGDEIKALIRGTAINQDGPSSALTAPNGPAQQAVIRRALANGRVDPGQVSYVEAHGTGTSLGDPIEVQALGSVFGAGRGDGNRLAIGSVKTNIGHLEAAAGMAGLIKVVLALQHREIPPHLHLQAINPHFSLAELPVAIPTTPTPWSPVAGLRIAGVSAFGFSGTNAHVVLEQPPALQAAPSELPERAAHIFCLSAKNGAALEDLAQRCERHLAAADAALPDLCFSANTGRTHHEHRLAVVAGTVDQARDRLRRYSSEGDPDASATGVAKGAPKVAFLAPGVLAGPMLQGGQLYEILPGFRDALGRCAVFLDGHAPQPLADLLWGDGPDIRRPRWRLPVLVALEYALGLAWRSWGIEPVAVLGHGAGEYAAASLTGALEIEDALRLAEARGALIEAQPPARSVVVNADEDLVARAVSANQPGSGIVAIDGLGSIVVTGDGAALGRVIEALERDGATHRYIDAASAVHLPRLGDALDAFIQVAEGVSGGTARGFVSAATGRVAADELSGPAYWVRQLHEPIRLSDGMAALHVAGCRVLVEVGPGATLLGLGRRCHEIEGAQWLASMRPGRGDWEQILESLGRMYVAGVSIDWGAFDRGHGRQRVVLPTYPFQRKRYWLAAGDGPVQPRLPGGDGQPLLGRQLVDSAMQIYEARWRPDAPGYLKDHRVHGAIVAPGAALLELALEAATADDGTAGSALVDVVLQEPLVFEAADDERTVQVYLEPAGVEGHAFRILSAKAGGVEGAPRRWVEHANGRLATSGAPPVDSGLEQARRRCTEEVSVDEHYRGFDDMGLQYGGAFRRIDQLWRGSDAALGLIRSSEALVADLPRYRSHPTLLDACFQVTGALLPDLGGARAEPFVPVGFERVEVHRPLGAEVWCHVSAKSTGGAGSESISMDLRLYGADGRAYAEIRGMQLRRASRAALLRAAELGTDELLYEVSWAPMPTEPGADQTLGSPRGWLVLSDGPAGGALCARLRGQGAVCVEVVPHGGFQVLGEDRYGASPGNPTDLDQVLDALTARGHVDQNVVHMWSLAADAVEPPAAVQAAVCGSALRIVQRLANAGPDEAPRLWLVTRGAQAVGEAEAPLAVEQATLLGLGRVIALEHPELRCERIDLDPGELDGGAEGLWTALRCSDGEEEVALRGGKRLARRLVRRRSVGGESFLVDVSTRGDLDSLGQRALQRRTPGPGEVEVQIAAAALNFRDVLMALGLYPGDVTPLGGECAGWVSAVGEGVDELSLGDEVVVFQGGNLAGCFASHVITMADLVAPLPSGLGLTEAASLPGVFLTAHLCLNELAALAEGERVLIHGAAGGVGLAAVQLAQQAGAEVFVTEGDEAKLAYLRTLGLPHVTDARTLAFADEVMERTGGAGVDVALNFLTGEYIPKTLSLLAQNGRFVEIGKRGIWDADQVAALRPDVRYHVVALDNLTRDEPAEVGAMLREVLARFADGELHPLPLQAFTLEEVTGAFRHMQQGRHIGKVVVTMPPSDRPLAIRSDGTYLITGGLGGLGLLVARALVDRGARHLALAELREATPSDAERIAELEARGAAVAVLKGDVSRAEDVEAMLGEVGATGPPLRGVIHLAGVLDDGLLVDQQWERFERVFGPKVAGAWNLHSATRDLPLDLFVLFSSQAALLGSAAQGSYAAANAFLDALAHRRRAEGLSGLSVNWGPWGDVGMAAALGEGAERRWADAGIGTIAPETGLAALGRLFGSASAQVGVLRIDWPRYLAASGGGTGLLSGLVDAATKTVPSTRPDLVQRLDALPTVERRQRLVEEVRSLVIKILGLDVTSPPDGDAPLMDLGMDSLMAVELRGALGRLVGQAMSATVAFDYPSIDALAAYIEGAVFRKESVSPQASSVLTTTTLDEPIAVIGIGCRFPGGGDGPEAFWSMLREGRDAVTEVPAGRWDVDAFYDPDPDVPGKMYSKWGGFLEQVDGFDPLFFSISPHEAVAMDPQQRLLLEVSWEALEHAGQAAERLVGGRVGVYVGISTTDYQRHLFQGDNFDSVNAYTGTGATLSPAAGRLSYTLGVHGPALVVDTACSSSLVTAHLACQSLRSGECDMALAGGVNLILSPFYSIAFSKARMLSPDGRCKTFDATANGYVRGEGCGIVVLKRLSDALASGDNILALLRGTAVNQDGRSSALTAPNGPSQEAVIRAALSRADVAPAEVRYLEAHGTGTSLGDPIETRALGAVYGEGRRAADRLAVGSVKTNIGHLETAAGVAGLIKAVLALSHEEIPPHLNLEGLNPHIPLGELPLAIPTRRTPWRAGACRRLAALSSFGFSGTNAHAVLEEAPLRDVAVVEEARVHLLCLSARSEAALCDLAVRCERHLRSHPEQSFVDVCYTASAGRMHHKHRLAATAASGVEAAEKLSRFASGGKAPGLLNGQRGGKDQRRVALLFSGYGAQYPGMGVGLYDEIAALRDGLDRCAELLRHELDRPLMDVLDDAEALANPALGEPAVFALEYALWETWRAWGVEPSMVMGHGVGEYVAACVAGVLSLEDGIKLAAARGRVSRALPDNGAMAVVFVGEEEVGRALAVGGGEVSIASVNGPQELVLSGVAEALDAVLAQLSQRGAAARRLAPGRSFQSPLVDPLLKEFEQATQGIDAHIAEISLVSGLTGCRDGEGSVESDYWRRQVRETLRPYAGLETLRAAGCDLFLEVGPAAVLLGIGARSGLLPVGIATLQRGGDDRASLLESLGKVYICGGPIDWEGVHRDVPHVRVPLPTYPFERGSYWGEPSLPQVEADFPGARHPLLGEQIVDTAMQVFEACLAPGEPAFLEDHKVHGMVVVPGAAFLVMAFEAANRSSGAGMHQLGEVEIREPLVLSAGEGRAVQVLVMPAEGPERSFQVLSQRQGEPENEWVTHARGTVSSGGDVDGESPEQLEQLRARCSKPVEVEEFYAEFKALGLDYGPTFRRVEEVWQGDGEALARLSLVDGDYALHPSVLDACFQVVAAALPGEAGDIAEPFVPVGVDRFELTGQPVDGLWCHVRVEGAEKGQVSLSARLTIFTAEGQPIGSVDGLHLMRASRDALTRAARQEVEEWLYEEIWRKSPPADAEQPDVAGSWLVFADRGGVWRKLVDALQEQGGRCLIVEAGGAYERRGELAYVVDPLSLHDFEYVVEEATSKEQPLRGVVHLWSLDAEAAGELESALELSCASALHLVQALVKDGAKQQPRLWLVTAGAQLARPSDMPSVAQAPLLGLGRVVVLEHPELACTRIDLERSELGPEKLIEEILAGDFEDEIALRTSGRYVRRLARKGNEVWHRPFRVELETVGDLDSIAPCPAERRPPSPGEVEVQVHAAALNFRDLLMAMGMYPGPQRPLGGEAAGTVSAVGEGVEDIAPGDEVVVFQGGNLAGCLGAFVTSTRSLVVPKPGHLSFPESAAIPGVFLTAHYCLNELARMAAGDRVLIHGAAGGVGLAGIQLAQRVGAVVIATEGRPDKLDYLRSIGVEHVVDGRTLDFADEVRARSKGGVDIVLNFLTGDYIPESLSLLREGGRFVEIGKREIWTPDQVKQVRDDVEYFVVALDQLTEEDPDRVGGMLREVMTGFEAGILQPLPVKGFPVKEVVDAFRFMQQGKHVGKVAVEVAALAESSGASLFRGDGTYFITGGLGGLGLRLVEWMVGQGAQHLVIYELQQPGEDVLDHLRRIEGDLARIEVVIGDASKRSELQAAIGRISDEMPPLRGVFHLAGILDDGTIARQDWSRFERVFGPKVVGAWALHEATRGLPLDHFVMFSSQASLMGSHGQGNYAAANAFLDSLACLRQAEGLPALSVNWGPWGAVGMATAQGQQVEERWHEIGIQPIPPDQGFDALAQMLKLGGSRYGSLRVDWRRFFSSYLGGHRVPAFEDMVGSVSVSDASDSIPGQSVSRLERDLLGLAAEERREQLQNLVRGVVVKVLGIDPAVPPLPNQPLMDLGMDSLMAVELRRVLGRKVERPLPATLAFDYPNIGAITDYLEAELFESQSNATVVPSADPGGGGPDEPIAIVGMSCRFPGGADDPQTFWRLLSQGGVAISEVPPDRWDVDALYDPDPDAPGKMNTRWGGFITGVDKFDALFFGISPREAESMDPQQRLLLEVCWEAIEASGRPPASLAGASVGVFMGICTSDYQILQLMHGGVSQVTTYFNTGVSHSVAAGRISYIMGLQGPSIVIDTACSSSLVAAHLACQSLRQGECRAALAGGVNLILSPETTVGFTKLKVMAPDGLCKAFDARGDGYVRSEGCGVVMLKRLSDALDDGDRVLALLAGTAVNQDGASSGLTAPNGPSQQVVIRRALEAASVAPNEVDYVEAHGTGTSLGDPIEVQALSETLGVDRGVESHLALGSVKTNLGHLEAAAGVAGLIKVVLALQNQRIPPHPHLQEINPHIDIATIPITIPTAGTPWPAGSRRRIAGLSSFGFSGTNAHVIIQEAPAAGVAERDEHRRFQTLCISAPSTEALGGLAWRYAGTLRAKRTSAHLVDVCYTAAKGRSHHEHRVAIVAKTVTQAAELLDAAWRGLSPVGLVMGRAGTGSPMPAFLFTGHGSNYPNMGRQLYEESRVYRQAFDCCSEILQEHLKQPLPDVLFFSEGFGSGRLEDMAYAQPMLFTLQYALSELWKSWGVTPMAVIGHSAGEYVAAVVAGVFSLEDGLKLIAARGRLMGGLPPGGKMAAVMADEEWVSAAIEPFSDRISVATVNAPENTVVSGDAAALADFLAEVTKEGIETRPLDISIAAHSPQLDPILDEFEDVARQVNYSAPQVSYISNLTGGLVEGDEVCSARYWRRHLRQPVRFATGMAALGQMGVELCLEIGPRATLLGIGSNCLPDDGIAWLPSLRKSRDDWEQILESVGELYVRGVELDWDGIFCDNNPRRVEIPSTQYQRDSHWFDASSERSLCLIPDAQDIWKCAVVAGREQARRGADGAGWPPGREADEEIDQLCGRYISQALGGLGIGSNDACVHEATRSKVSPEYQRLVGRWVDAAEDLTAASGSDGGFGDLDTERLVEKARAKGADTRLLDLIQRCGPRLADVVESSVDPLELIFPEGSFDCTQGLYRDSAVAKYCNGVVRAALEGILRALPNGAMTRILEVGAGTGGTTAWLLPLLRSDRAEYHFTDLSNLFLQRAEEEFGASYPFVRYALLDIEAHPRSQGFDVHGCDVVVASNVLHATEQIAVAVSNIRQMLAPGGVLILTEMTTYPVWFDVTFGLVLKPFTDEEILSRGGVPTLPPERWKAVLEANGFGDICAFPEPEIQSTGQHVFVARAMDHGTAPARRAFSTLGGHFRPPQRSSSWLGEAQATASAVSHPLLNNRLYTQIPIFQADISLDSHGFLRDHRVYSQVVFPGAAYIEMAIAASEYVFGKPLSLSGTMIHEALLLDEEDPAYALQTQILTNSKGKHEFRILGTSGEPRNEPRWVVHASGAMAELAAETTSEDDGVEIKREIDRARCKSDFPVAVFYQNLATIGLEYGVAFQGIRSLACSDGEAIGKIGVPTGRFGGVGEYWLHPVVLDSSFQMLGAAAFGGTDVSKQGGAFMPVEIGEVVVYKKVQGSVWCQAKVSPEQCGADYIVGDITIWDDNGGLVAQVSKVLARRTRPEMLLSLSKKHLGDLFYEVEWRPKERADAEIPAGAASPSRIWAVFADERGVGAKLIEAIRGRGERCVVVRPGPRYSAEDDGVFHVDPLSAGDFVRLIGAFDGVSDIVHLWGLDCASDANSLVREIWDELALSCHSVLHLVQGVVTSMDAASPRLWLVSSRAQDAGYSRNKIAPSQVPMWGLGRVIALEHSDLDCTRIDIGDPEDRGELQRLQSEIFSPDVEREVALRGQSRLVRRIVRSSTRADRKRVAILDDATYLVTGGLGGLGFCFAQWIARKGGSHLVLVGRSGASRKIAEQIAELEAAGVEVCIRQADVSREEEMAEVMAYINAELPPLRGVVHSAGVLDDGLLLGQTKERFDRVLAPKVKGSWILHKLTMGLELDFFVLFSSAASLLGSPGQGNHAAANAFLDGLAIMRRERGAPAVSINWGVWSEIGSAVSASIEGVSSISPDEGLRAFEQVLSTEMTQVGVLAADWEQIAAGMPASWQRGALEDLMGEVKNKPSESAAGGLRQRLMDSPTHRHMAIVVESVTGAVAQLLKVAPATLDIRRPLMEMGLDSLMAVDLRKRIAALVGVQHALPASLVFRFPTVEALASHLVKDVLEFGVAGQRSRGETTKAPVDEPGMQDSFDAILDEVEELSVDDLENELKKND